MKTVRQASPIHRAKQKATVKDTRNARDKDKSQKIASSNMKIYGRQVMFTL